MHANQRAVYAVTICVPLQMHERMSKDPSIRQLDIVKNARLDGELVHLQGKIGESTRFPRRKKKTTAMPLLIQVY